MLETKRLILRKWKESDLEQIYAIGSDPKVMEFYPSLQTKEEAEGMIQKINESINENNFGLYATELKEDNKLVGFVGLQKVPFDAHFTPAVEIGWRIAHKYWGKGFAPEVAKEVLNHGFYNCALNEIVAMTVPENLRSRRVMEKLGMTYDQHDDFDNPKIDKTHRFCRHVLYRITAKQVTI